VIAAEQYATRLVVPASQRMPTTRWGSHKDIAAKALRSSPAHNVPATLTKLEQAVKRATPLRQGRARRARAPARGRRNGAAGREPGRRSHRRRVAGPAGARPTRYPSIARPHGRAAPEGAGKAEQDELVIEAPSIHVHERLSTEAIVKAARRENAQITLFADPGLDRATQVEFYEHEMGWANRLILGDSLVVMTSLLERERMAGQAQLVYIDPPYGINYNSNFQARISDRSPKETNDGSLTREPEQIQAYRDTWELGLHSYLTYLRERLVAARELLADSGSVVVQIGPDNIHLVWTLMDEVFGRDNACPMITVVKTTGHDATLLPEICDCLIWYAKDRTQVKYRQLFEPRIDRSGAYRHVELPDAPRRAMTAEERAKPDSLPSGCQIFRYDNITSQGTSRAFEFEFQGRTFRPPPGSQWKIRREGMDGLARSGYRRDTLS